MCEIRKNRQGGVMTIDFSNIFEKQRKAVVTIEPMIRDACGIANNTAWAICIHAHEHLQKHPNYKQACKRAFKKVYEEYAKYERNLIYNQTCDFFRPTSYCKDDMMKFRKDINKDDMVEMWRGLASTAYIKTKPLFDVLFHKAKKYYSANGYQHVEELSYALVGHAALSLAAKVYKEMLIAGKEDFGASLSVADSIFSCFNLINVGAQWEKACSLLDKNFKPYLEKWQNDDILITCGQIFDAWTDVDNYIESVSDMYTDFEEMFKNRRELKKALQKLKE